MVKAVSVGAILVVLDTALSPTLATNHLLTKLCRCRLEIPVIMNRRVQLLAT